MVFVLPPVERRQSFGEQLGLGIGQGASNLIEQLANRKKERKENEALKKITGEDFSGLTPDVKREFLKLYTGGRSQKEQEKHQMLETGLGTIQQMRDLLQYAGGFTSNPINKLLGMVPSEVQQKRAELSQLGTSLIPLAAAGVSIRNQREFDKYSKIITDPNSSPQELEGALNGLESIISRQVSPSSEMREEKEQSSKPTFDISNPSHKKVFDALMKKYSGNREKVRRELSKHYEE